MALLQSREMAGRTLVVGSAGWTKLVAEAGAAWSSTKLVSDAVRASEATAPRRSRVRAPLVDFVTDWFVRIVPLRRPRSGQVTCSRPTFLVNNLKSDGSRR